MLKRTVSKSKIDRERDPIKLEKVLIKKGYPSGKVPKGYEAHHKKPVAEGGVTTPSNIKVITKEQHKKIHKENRKKGKI